MDISIGDRRVGDGHPCFIIGELGINHSGDLDIATALITAAAESLADAVKFQKRTVDVVYTREELARPRQSPFGITNGDLKRGLEFGREQYDHIAEWARYHGIQWFASPWDVGSVEFLEAYNPPCYKIASACLTDEQLLRTVIDTRRPILLSVGMSDWRQIDKAVAMIIARHNQLVVMQCTSTYPSEDFDLHLNCIPAIRERYGCLVGYSGHERGLATTVAAVVMGACVVERHLTLDRSMWGSDQAASIEPPALRRLVRDIRAVEHAMGQGEKRLLPAEEPIMAKLRRVSA